MEEKKGFVSEGAKEFVKETFIPFYYVKHFPGLVKNQINMDKMLDEINSVSLNLRGSSSMKNMQTFEENIKKSFENIKELLKKTNVSDETRNAFNELISDYEKNKKVDKEKLEKAQRLLYQDYKKNIQELMLNTGVLIVDSAAVATAFYTGGLSFIAWRSIKSSPRLFTKKVAETIGKAYVETTALGTAGIAFKEGSKIIEYANKVRLAFKEVLKEGTNFKSFDELAEAARNFLEVLRKEHDNLFTLEKKLFFGKHNELKADEIEALFGKEIKEVLKNREVSGKIAIIDKSSTWFLNLPDKKVGDAMLAFYRAAIAQSILDVEKAVEKMNKNVKIIYMPHGGDEGLFMIVGKNLNEGEINLIADLLEERIRKNLVELTKKANALENIGVKPQIFSDIKINSLDINLSIYNNALSIKTLKGTKISELKNIYEDVSKEEALDLIKKVRGIQDKNYLKNLMDNLNNNKEINSLIEGYKKTIKKLDEGSLENVLKKNEKFAFVDYRFSFNGKTKKAFETLTQIAEKGINDVKSGTIGPSVLNLLGHDFNDKINDLFLSLLRKNLDEAGLKNAEIIKIEGKPSAFVVTGVEEKDLQEILQKTNKEFIEQLNKIGFTINEVKTFTGKNLDEVSEKIYYAKIPDLFKNDTNMKMIVDYFNNQKEFANSFVLLSKTQKEMLKDLISKVPINEFKHNQKEMEIAINTLKNAIDKFSMKKDARNINDFFQIWEDEIMKIAGKENYKNIATNFSVFSIYILSHVNLGLKKQQTEKNIEKEKINK